MMTREKEEYVVRFEKGRQGDPIARVQGVDDSRPKVAFPARSWQRHGLPYPQVGDEYIVCVDGENPRGTVYFLIPVAGPVRYNRMEVGVDWLRDQISQHPGWRQSPT